MIQQKVLPQLIIELRKFFGFKLRVEVETNGTVTPSEDMALYVDQFNISPKLSNSGMPKKRRIKPEVMEQLVFLALRDKAILKFVVTKEKDVREIIFDYLGPFRIPNRCIWLMPGCSTREQFEAVSPLVAGLCKDHGFHFSSRLQINLWNEVTGV